MPEAAPREDQVVLSSYGESTPVPTAALMRRVVPEAPAWLAAVGAVGDLGTAAFALQECDGVPREAVRRLAGLVNAPRRVPRGPVRTGLALLVEHDDLAEALLDDRLAELEDAKRRVKAELDRALRAPPQVGDTAALLRFSSDCQIHPLVATTWSRRLAPRMVIAANDGYLPGRVNFSVRGGMGSLPAQLRAALPGVDGEFAHGHEHASGGSLEPGDFARLLAKVGL
jgi:single-stranded-DNA-specific exonuclease